MKQADGSMVELVEFALSFFLWVSGALVIIFLRIFQQLLRMSKYVEITLQEKELKDRREEVYDKLEKLQEEMRSEMKASNKPPEQAEVG